VRKAFISYARVNRAHVDELVEHLGVLGWQVWIDSSLRGGQHWWDEILRQITDCDVFVPIISIDALNSAACQREFDWAEALDKPVLPVAVEPLPRAIPRRLSLRQIIDYSDAARAEHAALRLAGALSALPSAPSLPEPLPSPPAAPLSYLTDLVELVSGQHPLDIEQQRRVLHQVEPALHSVDPQERQGGLDILELLSGRENLYADVYRQLTWLKENAMPSGRVPISASSARSADSSPHPAKQASRRPATPSVPSVPPERKTPRTKLALGAVLAVVLVGAAITGYLVWPHSSAPKTQAAQSLPSGSSTQPQAQTGQSAPPAMPSSKPAPASGQTVLPVQGHDGLGLDDSGNVYVSDGPQVMELAAGGSTPIELPFTGVGSAKGVALGAGGDVYVTDYIQRAVWKLPTGSSAAEKLSLDGLACGNQEVPISAIGVAVDGAGTLYLTDGSCQGRVVSVTAGSSKGTILPFTGLSNADGVAVDSSGNVYVADTGNNAVLELQAGSGRPAAMAFTGLVNPSGVAVDGFGNVYVTDTGNKRVLKLAAGSSTQTELSITGLSRPHAVAVDTSGNLYVNDGFDGRVLKVPAG
jgi:sugar lactone lactonase YvrE